MRQVRGISLLEIIIAMGMSALVFVVVSSLLVSIINSNLKSGRQEKFEGVKNTLSVEISNRVRWAKTVTADGDGLTADEIRYYLDNGRIWRDGEPLTPESVEVKDFWVENLSADPTLVSLEITAEMQDKNFPLATDNMRLVVSQRRTQIEINE